MKATLLINSIIWCFLCWYLFYTLGLAILALSIPASLLFLVTAILFTIVTFIQLILGIAAH